MPTPFADSMYERGINARGVTGRITVVAIARSIAWLCLPKRPLLDGISFSRRAFDRNGKPFVYVLAIDQLGNAAKPMS